MDDHYLHLLEKRIKEYEDCFKQIRLLLIKDTCIVSTECLRMIDLLFKYNPFLFK